MLTFSNSSFILPGFKKRFLIKTKALNSMKKYSTVLGD